MNNSNKDMNIGYIECIVQNDHLVIQSYSVFKYKGNY